MDTGQSGSRWYYVWNNERHGPIDEAALKELLRGGRLGANDYVWHEAMPDWQEAQRVPSLVPSLLPQPNAEPGTLAETVHFDAPLARQPAAALQSPQAFQHQPQYQPHYPPQQYGAGPPGHFHPQHSQQAAQLVAQSYALQQPHYAPQPYPAPAPQYAPAYQQVAVVNPPKTTTTGLKVAGFIFNIFFIPGLGTFFVGRPGQAVTQILLVIFGVGISLTGVGALVGIPMAIGAWIWGLVTVATVPTAPQVAFVHHTYHAPR
jgi:TM2 domain-containing membrane protein YozV